MKKISLIFCASAVLMLVACDLQPRIVSLPDSVGDFISARYPALLADPDAQPEIYNSAATDYGVYASPELYGSVGADDYVTYASVDDYIVPPSPSQDVVVDTTSTEYGTDTITFSQTYYADSGQAIETATPTPAADEYLRVSMYGGGATVKLDATSITVVRGDTLYGLAKKHNISADELARANNLSQPYNLSVGQVLHLPGASSVTPVVAVQPALAQTTPQKVYGGTPTETRVELQEIIVGAGDTLYSLSRQYSVPVNDLAVMNNLAAPFALSVGQRLKVPNLKNAPVRSAATSAAVSTTNGKALVVATAAPVKSTYGTPTAPVAQAAKAPAATSPKTETPKAKTATTNNTPKTTKKAETTTAKETTMPKKKISSDPSKKLPAISARSASKFSWPVRGSILSHYGAKSNGLFNDGINIGASRGTAVKAAENGVVAYAGNEVKGMGNLVIIQHADGWMTVYAHMDTMAVRRGAKVTVGQKIGTVGATGKVDKPQLHFEIRKGTKAYNPSQYLKNK